MQTSSFNRIFFSIPRLSATISLYPGIIKSCSQRGIRTYENYCHRSFILQNYQEVRPKGAGEQSRYGGAKCAVYMRVYKHNI